MVKEKQKSDNPVPENPVVSLLKEMQSGIIQINSNVLQLGKNDKILSDRMDNMEKNPPKKGIVDQVQQFADIAKSLGLDKVFGAIGESVMGKGGEEAAGTQQNIIPPEDYQAYVEFRKGTMTNLLETQKAQLQSLNLANQAKQKELESDLH